jgi:hypothetical protein
MRSLLALFVLVTSACFGQVNRYSATSGDVSLSGAGTSFTIQQPAAGAKILTLEAIQVYCSVACNVTQAVNGTAATATAGTISAIPPATIPAAATVWTASNVGAGTAVGAILHLAAAVTQVIDVSKVQLGNAPASNYTVTISSITGNANITLFWSER